MEFVWWYLVRTEAGLQKSWCVCLRFYHCNLHVCLTVKHTMSWWINRWWHDITSHLQTDHTLPWCSPLPSGPGYSPLSPPSPASPEETLLCPPADTQHNTPAMTENRFVIFGVVTDLKQSGDNFCSAFLRKSCGCCASHCSWKHSAIFTFEMWLSSLSSQDVGGGGGGGEARGWRSLGAENSGDHRLIMILKFTIF